MVMRGNLVDAATQTEPTPAMMTMSTQTDIDPEPAAVAAAAADAPPDAVLTVGQLCSQYWDQQQQAAEAKAAPAMTTATPAPEASNPWFGVSAVGAARPEDDAWQDWSKAWQQDDEVKDGDDVVTKARNDNDDDEFGDWKGPVRDPTKVRVPNKSRRQVERERAAAVVGTAVLPTPP